MNLNQGVRGNCSAAADKRLFSEAEAGELNPTAAKARLSEDGRAGSAAAGSDPVSHARLETHK